MKITINADDLGCSRETNAAIIQGLKTGIIDRTTAMANAPFFEEACQLIHDNGFEDRVGIHFNISTGIPLGARITRSLLFCSEEGEFKYRRNNKIFLSREEMNIISAECESQILKFHKYGLKPDHFDSHKHVHTEFFIFRAVEPILKKYKFSSVRILDNVVVCSTAKKAYKTIFNAYLRAKWKTTDYFSEYSVILNNKALISKNDSIIEAMVHPTFNSKGIMIDALTGKEIILNLQELKSLVH
ncbi:MAG: ChbG/HpnK family deacetylase [Bacteroidetes bacterium]|nr:ChbG/HpnK family deacetylase [Bacteroidota bacterium]